MSRFSYFNRKPQVTAFSTLGVVAAADAANDLIAFWTLLDLSKVWSESTRATHPAVTTDLVGYIDEYTGKTDRDMLVLDGNRPAYTWDATRGRWKLHMATSAKLLTTLANYDVTDTIYMAAAVSRAALGSAILFTVGTATTNGAQAKNFSSVYRVATTIQSSGDSQVSGATPSGSSPLDVPIVIELVITATHLKTAFNGGAWNEIAYTGGFTDFTATRFTIFSANTAPSGADERSWYGEIVLNENYEDYRERAVILLKQLCGLLPYEYPDEVHVVPLIGASNTQGAGDQATSTPPDFGKGFVYIDGFDGPTTTPGTGAALWCKDPCKAGNFAFASVATTGSFLPAWAKAFYDTGGKIACMVSGAESGAGITTGSVATCDWSPTGVLVTNLAEKTARAVKWFEDRGTTVHMPAIVVGSGPEADSLALVSKAAFKTAVTDPTTGLVTRCRAAFATAFTTIGCSSELIAACAELEFCWHQIESTPINDYSTIEDGIDEICDEDPDVHHMISPSIGAADPGNFNVDEIHHNQTLLNAKGGDGGENYADLYTP